MTKELLEQGVHYFIGLYTSASRKRILPLLDQFDGLLLYPTQYEGKEAHSSVIYCGPTPNQSLLSFVPWLMQEEGTRFALIGSDYIYPREMNVYLHALMKQYGGSIVRESYFSLGERSFERELNKIEQLRPDVIFSTLVGDSVIHFYEQSELLTPHIPIASTITSETEFAEMQLTGEQRHYSCFPYFQSSTNASNARFLNDFNVPLVSSAMEGAYNCVHLLAEGMNKANHPSEVKTKMTNRMHSAPRGDIFVDPDNQHVHMKTRIGEHEADGRFQVRFESEKRVAPTPFTFLDKKLQRRQRPQSPMTTGSPCYSSRSLNRLVSTLIRSSCSRVTAIC
ncbi:urea ABC transporter, substrate binding protein UrtA [Geomicrobium sp. JCM 19037]|nr:urea ABC transporter, substrate binding protein UrtA [Geomicrobium sp. JCM 19037]